MPESVLSASELAEYLLELGGALLSYGCSTYRLEQVLRLIGEQKGLAVDAFAVPTGLWVSVRDGSGAEPSLRMKRVKEWAVDLDRLAHADRILNDVVAQKCSLAEARQQLDALERARPTYGTWLAWLASAGAAGSASVFFDARPTEIAFATAGGLVVGGLRTLVGRNARLRLLQDFLGGLVASGIAWAATTFDPHLSREVLVLSVIVLLVPGMAITTGLSELAYKNLVSGASKLMEAMITFLSIVFGIAALVGLEHYLRLRPGVALARLHVGVGWDLIALVVASTCFGVMFRVPRRWLWTSLLSGAIGWTLSGIGARYVPTALAAFVASLGVSLFANAAARLSNRPSQVFLLPGLVLLVPGSFGFLSLESFLRGEFASGTSKLFDMFLVAAAIVTGLLVANAALPSRKIL